jgi:hypothetical protein
MFYLNLQVCLYYIVAPCSYLRNYSDLDLFTFLCIYSNVFYMGGYPFGHKLAQLGELLVTPPSKLRLILGVLQYGIRAYGLADHSCKSEHGM